MMRTIERAGRVIVTGMILLALCGTACAEIKIKVRPRKKSEAKTEQSSKKETLPEAYKETPPEYIKKVHPLAVQPVSTSPFVKQVKSATPPPQKVLPVKNRNASQRVVMRVQGVDDSAASDGSVSR